MKIPEALSAALDLLSKSDGTPTGIIIFAGFICVSFIFKHILKQINGTTISIRSILAAAVFLIVAARIVKKHGETTLKATTDSLSKIIDSLNKHENQKSNQDDEDFETGCERDKKEDKKAS